MWYSHVLYSCCIYNDISLASHICTCLIRSSLWCVHVMWQSHKQFIIQPLSLGVQGVRIFETELYLILVVLMQPPLLCVEYEMCSQSDSLCSSVCLVLQACSERDLVCVATETNGTNLQHRQNMHVSSCYAALDQLHRLHTVHRLDISVATNLS